MTRKTNTCMIILCVLIIVITGVLLYVIEINVDDSVKESSVDFAQEFEYNELTVSCDKSELAQQMIDFDSGDPAYKRITWEFGENKEYSVYYVMEVYPIEQAGYVMESNAVLYENNADECEWLTTSCVDKQLVAIYEPSETFPEGVTMRIYYYPQGDNFYVLTFEQHYLLNGVAGIKMSEDCNDIISDTIALLKGEELHG